MGQNQVQAANEALLADNRSQLLFLNFPVVGSAHTNNFENETTDSAAARNGDCERKENDKRLSWTGREQKPRDAISELLRDRQRF